MHGKGACVEELQAARVWEVRKVKFSVGNCMHALGPSMQRIKGKHRMGARIHAEALDLGVGRVNPGRPEARPAQHGTARHEWEGRTRPADGARRAARPIGPCSGWPDTSAAHQAHTCLAVTLRRPRPCTPLCFRSSGRACHAWLYARLCVAAPCAPASPAPPECAAP